MKITCLFPYYSKKDLRELTEYNRIKKKEMTRLGQRKNKGGKSDEVRGKFTTQTTCHKALYS